MTYEDLFQRIAQMQQIIIVLVMAGVTLLVVVWVLWTHYENTVAFLKDDGAVGRYSMWLTKKERAKRIAGGRCPNHNVVLFRGDKCPFKGCKYTRHRDGVRED